MLSLLLLCLLRFAHDRRYCAYSGLSRKKDTKVCSLWSCYLCSCLALLTLLSTDQITEFPDLSGPDFVTSLHSRDFCVLNLKVCWQQRRTSTADTSPVYLLHALT